LFNDTIYHNIAYGNVEASREQIEAAARDAHIHNVIESLPEKYNTRVGERGLMLSGKSTVKTRRLWLIVAFSIGGEKQRIALARTILKDPPILFFDEATSALDTHTEQSILANIRSILRQRQCTSVFIAHRLRTISDADLIIVLRDGQLVEQGQHDDLISGRVGQGVYRDMWRSQEQAELEDKETDNTRTSAQIATTKSE
jgi:ATP-binding cassette subfamily B (MDR/TAP) protein 7